MRVWNKIFGFGTVIEDLHNGILNLVVEFDNPHYELHNCRGRVKTGRGYFCKIVNVEQINDNIDYAVIKVLNS